MPAALCCKTGRAAHPICCNLATGYCRTKLGKCNDQCMHIIHPLGQKRVVQDMEVEGTLTQPYAPNRWSQKRQFGFISQVYPQNVMSGNNPYCAGTQQCATQHGEPLQHLVDHIHFTFVEKSGYHTFSIPHTSITPLWGKHDNSAQHKHHQGADKAPITYVHTIYLASSLAPCLRSSANHFSFPVCMPAGNTLTPWIESYA